MADLEARYENDPQFGWRRKLPDTPILLGRHPGTPDGWATEWDNFISRQHANLHWADGKLTVQKRPTAGNPVFYKGVPTDEFAVSAHESFRIGNTTFTLIDEAAPIEMSIAPKELRQVRFDNADQRIEALASLPEIIRQSPEDQQFEMQVVDALLKGIPHADGAAVVRLLPESTDDDLRVAVVASARRGSNPAEVRPSRRLVFDAIRRRLSTLHVWNQDNSRTVDSKFSLNDPGTDWALCAPLLEESCHGTGLYVVGRLPREVRTADSMARDNELKSDLKFARLTGDIYGALRQVHDLQKRQTLLLKFLSPKVAQLMQERATGKSIEDMLEERVTNVTVLFCDLRGSCRIVEEGSSNLAKLWGCVSEALNVMAAAIIDNDGVIGDFQGDAAMGFWGWPVSMDNQIERAARAALQIRKHFQQASSRKGSSLANFACGIGIAHGPAIAGRIGTLEQFKVGVFGPVVNLASRLESMTKQFRVQILTDEAVGTYVSEHRSDGFARVRRLARVEPAGMSVPVVIHELLPTVGLDSLPEQKRLDYESAYEAMFEKKRWSDASAKLRSLSNDGPSDFLQKFMDKYPQGPSPDWDGIIELEKK